MDEKRVTSGGAETGKKRGKLVILSAPSGSGKTTIMRAVLSKLPKLEFSVSATSRAPRHNEKHGTDYLFMSNEKFAECVERSEFVEWEEVYPGTKYGTLRSEMERIWAKGSAIVFDVDVKGGIALKKIFGDDALSIFIMPPSLEELRRRLETRGTDSAEMIEKRLGKARIEIEDADKFDKIIKNDSLEEAVRQVEGVIAEFLKE